MRVWDIHPGYLSRQSLLGQHAEIHAVYSVLCGCRKGYSRHPETMRWKNHLELLVDRHDLTVKEMVLRGFNHFSKIQKKKNNTEIKKIKILSYVDKPARQFELLREKYLRKGQSGRIPLPKNSSSFWAHHKYSIMGRGYRYYQEIQGFLKTREDYPIEKDNELIEKVFYYMAKSPTEKSLKNVMDHLWGYFKNVCSEEERRTFRALKQEKPDRQLDYLFSLAQTYNQDYLLQSTIFADFLFLPF